MSQTDTLREVRAAHFERLGKRLDGKNRPWIHAIRKDAMDRFGKLGFPTVRDEAWKHTDVTPIARADFRPAPETQEHGIDRKRVEALGIQDVAGPLLVFVNGRFASSLSRAGDLPAGVRVVGLAEALETDALLLETHLARHAPFENHAFTALNTAFHEDGAFVHVPRGQVLEAPIRLLFVATQAGDPIECHPRVLVVADESSQATILETYVGTGSTPYFTNVVTEVVLGPNAIVHHAKVQLEAPAGFHVASLQAVLGRSSRFTSHSVALGSALARNEVNVLFDAEGAECVLDGLYLGGKRQHTDNQTFVDHAKPHCTSHQLYKGILWDQARGVFNGRVLLRQDAQKTDAHQSNKNLLLSKGARVDTKPQLEIYADDVRCTHGATIGRLDEDAIHYLRSRGIGMQSAREMLTVAFAGQVLDRFEPADARAHLDLLVGERLSEVFDAPPVRSAVTESRG